MLVKFFQNIALGFVVRAIKKYEAKIDWDLLKKDLGERVKKLIPGDLLDDEAVAVLNNTLAVCEKVLSAADVIEKAVHLAAAGKVKELLAYLKQAIVQKYIPEVLVNADSVEGLVSVEVSDDHVVEAIKLA